MSLLVAAALPYFLGLMIFLLVPFVGAATGWRGPSKAMLLLATMPLKRLSIVVSEHNDLLVKPMSFDAMGVERITLDGDSKPFTDPAKRLHTWLGLPFALANEEAGVLFAPQDAAAGAKKREYDERNEHQFYATDDEWAADGIKEWVPGAFTMSNAYELVDLSAAIELVDGGERSEYPQRVESIYQHAMDALHGGKSLSDMFRLFMPVLGFLATFGGIWFMASQFGTPGGGGGGSIVSFGGSALVAIVSSRRAAQAKQLLGFILVVALAAGGFVAMFIVWGLFLAIIGTVTFIAGLLTLPVLAQLGRLSTAAADFFASIFFKLGFASYRSPVLVWTAEQYELREYDELPETAPEPKWYALFGSRFGVSYEPGPEAFGQAGITNDELDEFTQSLATDGGEAASNVPPQRYEKAPALAPDGMGGFVPTDREDYAVRTDIALGWWQDSADGTKSMRTLLEAKEKYGGDSKPLSDKSVLYLTAAMSGLGAVLGIVIFLL